MNKNTVLNNESSDSPTNEIQKSIQSRNTQPKLIGKGAFGCVYKPQVNCSFKINSTQTFRDTYIKYISKIQVLTKDQNYDKSSDHETDFGKIIQTIPNYYMYFSPILESCPININVLSLEEITKCSIFDKTEENYINSKIQYIEGTSMSVYFNQFIKTNKEGFHSFGDSSKNKISMLTPPLLPLNFVKKFIQSYQHLIKAINLLQRGPDIIHYDLKDNNIIFDIKRGIPIIIDFGLSFNKKALFEFEHPKMLKEIFYVYYDAYSPWCIDIVLLSYISQNILKAGIQTNEKPDDLIKENYENGIVNVNELKNVVDTFINKNDILNWLDELNTKIVEKGIITKIKNQWYFYIESFEGKSWKDFIIDLRERYVVWDIYAISICFLTYIRDLNILNGKYEIPTFLNQMIQQLVKVFEKNV